MTKPIFYDNDSHIDEEHQLLEPKRKKWKPFASEISQISFLDLNGDKFICAKEIAKLYKLDHSYIRKLCRLKKPPCENSMKMGNFWIIKVKNESI